MRKKRFASRIITTGLAISLAASPVMADVSAVSEEAAAVETGLENAEQPAAETETSIEVNAESETDSEGKDTGAAETEEASKTDAAASEEETETAAVVSSEEKAETEAAAEASSESEEEIDTEEADLEAAWSKAYLFALTESAEIPREGSGISYLMDNIYMADTLEQIYENYSEEEILYIEENSSVELLGDANDYYYQLQKANLENVKANALWNRGIDAAGVTVAVIDSGLYSGHEDFDQSRILQGYNYVNNNEDTRDTAGHGTQVAGVLSAVRNNGIGVAGLLDQVNILPMRISANSSASPTIAVVSAALKDAVDKYDVQVVNMSIGQKKESETLEAAVKYAAEHNVIMVAAAGNDGTDAYYYPAAYDEVIGVGAVNSENTVRDNSQRNDSVFVTAPGENIYTTNVNNTYTVKSGTSYSAPYVTAMAAAAKAADRSMTIEAFKNLLISTSIDAGDAGYDTSYGYGIIDMDAFLTAVYGASEETGTAVSVTAAFRDTEGNEIAPSRTVRVEEGKNYTIASDAVSDYKAVSYIVENTASKNGTYSLNNQAAEKIPYAELSAGNAVITYVYEKVQSVTAEGAFEVQYERAYGSRLADAFKAVAETPDGGYIAVGYTFAESEEAGWGYNTSAGRAQNGNNDAIMVKFDSECRIEWARNFGTSGVERFEDVSVLSDGTILAVGQAPYDFGTGKNTASGYIVRLEDSRKPDEYEEIHLGGSKGDYIHAIEALDDGGYVIAGRTASDDAKDWKKTYTTTTATSEAFIARYDAEGTLVFSKCYDEIEGKRTYFNDVAIDQDGNIVAAGENQIAKFIYNAQIVKFDGKTGEILWSRSEGSSLTEVPDNSNEGHTSTFNSIAVLGDGTYAVAGYTKTTGSSTGEKEAKLLEDSSVNWGIAGEQDGIVVHYSGDGKVIRAKNIGTAGGTVTLTGVKSVQDGGYLVYGQTSNEIYGSDTYTWEIKGATDTIVIKYNSEDEVEWNQSYGTANKGEWFNDLLVKENGEIVIVGETNRDSEDGNIDASIWTTGSVEGDSKKNAEEEEIPIYADGVYEGSGIGFNTDANVVVSVTVADGKITEVKLVSHDDTKSYMKKASALLNSITEKQTSNVDVVTGATYSSRGLKRAAKAALGVSAEAAEVIESIEALPEAVPENREAIQSAADAYNALPEYAKEYVTNAEKLTEALGILEKLQAEDLMKNCSVSVKDAAAADGKTTAVITGLPADFDPLYTIEGLNFTVNEEEFLEDTVNKNLTISFTDAKPGTYTLKISDQKNKYGDLTADFTLSESKPADSDSDNPGTDDSEPDSSDDTGTTGGENKGNTGADGENNGSNAGADDQNGGSNTGADGQNSGSNTGADGQNSGNNTGANGQNNGSTAATVSRTGSTASGIRTSQTGKSAVSSSPATGDTANTLPYAGAFSAALLTLAAVLTKRFRRNR